MIDNLRKPVLFSNAIEQLLESRHSVFVEVGPHPILLSSIQQCIKPRHQHVHLLPSLRKEEPDRHTMLKSVCALYTHGCSIAWDNLYTTPAKYVKIPLLSWNRQRYWIDTQFAGSGNPWHLGRLGNSQSHPLLGERITLANSPSSFVWQTTFDPESLLFLKDHKINGEIVFPAAGYIEMALQSAAETSLKNSHNLSDFNFNESMILQMERPRYIQTLLSLNKDQSYSFGVYSRGGREEIWVLHASATFMRNDIIADDKRPAAEMEHEAIRKKSDREFTAEEFYKTLQTRGIQYDKSFRAVQHIWIKGEESLGQITLPDNGQTDSSVYQIHPALLDGCLQVIAST